LDYLLSRRNARVTRAALWLATASALACACGGGILRTAQTDGGAPDAATDGALDDGATQPEADGPEETPYDGGADAEDIGDQSADGCPFSAAVMPPVFSPPAQPRVSIGASWAISCPGSPPNETTIFYTTDQTLPTHQSMVYGGFMPFTSPGDFTIMAICSLARCDDSPVAQITYNVLSPWGTDCGCPPSPAVVSPAAGTMNNDFVAQMSSATAGVTICYTADGTTPTCDAATAVCTGTSKTYDSATGVPINGTMTDSTGTVVVQNIACLAGTAPSGVSVPITYVLAVADPTMDAPAPGTYSLPGGGGLTPTIRTMTMDSPGSPVTISLAADGGSPSCAAAGAELPNPTTFGGLAGEPPAITSTTTVSAVACKHGYKPSNVGSFGYTIH
jgi:hypothetical protein